MKKTNSLLLLIVVIILSSCGIAEKDYNPTTQLNSQEQLNFKYNVARYVCKLPRFATKETMFDKSFDSDYQKQAELINLDKYYKAKGDTVYFEISKIAPSFKFKYTATGGKLLKNETGEIVYYEEIYRTWKMEEDELKEKSKVLFTKMLQHQDLTPYYTQNSGNEEYIEFPDQKTVFNTSNRSWEVVSE